MKICITSAFEMHDKRGWSGTVAALVEQFEARGYVLDNFAEEGKFKYLIRGKLRRLYGILFYQKYSCRADEFGFFHHNAARYRKYLKDYDDDVLLFTGEHCLDRPMPGEIKCYAYIDRVWSPLIRMENTHKPGVERYIRRYEKNDKISLSYLEKCFTENEWSRRYIIDNYGLSEDKIINVGVGINTQYYMGKKDYSKHDLLIVLREGTENYKGLDLLLEAFQITRKYINDLSLHVVGTDYKKAVGVYYYYGLPRSVTIDLFQKCSLFAMPALLEPQGIVYLEALANKTPILGLNRFAFPEICGYGRYGFIASNATSESVSEQIIYAFSDPSRLEKMGLEGQQMVMKRYNWNAVVEKMLDVINVTTENKGGR